MEESDEPDPVIEIEADWSRDMWVIIGLGAHRRELPRFKARASFDCVARELITKANGRLRVVPAHRL